MLGELAAPARAASAHRGYARSSCSAPTARCVQLWRGAASTRVRPFPNRWLVADDDLRAPLRSQEREGNHHHKMLQPRRGRATSVGLGAATSQTNDGTGDDRVVSATAAVHHCWNQLHFLLELPLFFAGTGFFCCYNQLVCLLLSFFCWNQHLCLLELAFLFATIIFLRFVLLRLFLQETSSIFRTIVFLFCWNQHFFPRIQLDGDAGSFFFFEL